MAKKKMVKVAIPETAKKKMGISEAIRGALRLLGVDAPAKDVGELIASKYPEHAATVKKSIWGTYVSQQRKAVRKELGGSGVNDGKKSAPVKMTLDQALQVVESAKKSGVDIAALKSLIDEQGVGDLVKILDAIEMIDDEMTAHEQRQKRFSGLFG